MMQLMIHVDSVEFRCKDRSIGRYHYTDSFKPYLHPLTTPNGHELSIARPHDHRHHKAVMYSLATSLGNFWEEVPSPVHEKVGRQKHIDFRDVVESADPEEGVSFTETLRWVVDGDADDQAVFTETRKLAVRLDPGAGASGGYTWTWSTQLTTQRDCQLIQSVWAHELKPEDTYFPQDASSDQDVRINYHGLGIRLRRDMGGGTGGYDLKLDGQPFSESDFTKAMGWVGQSATYTGCIDGTLPVERASVTLAQDHPERQAHGFYAHSTAMQWLSFGPSWRGPVDLKAQDTINETYHITAADESPLPL